MILEVYWTEMIVEKQYMYIVIHRNEQLHNYHTVQYYWSNHCIIKIRANSVFKKKHVFILYMFNTSLFTETVAELLLSQFGKTKNRKKKEAPERQSSIRRRIAGQTRLEGNPCVAKPRQTRI